MSFSLIPSRSLSVPLCLSLSLFSVSVCRSPSLTSTPILCLPLSVALAHPRAIPCQPLCVPLTLGLMRDAQMGWDGARPPPAPDLASPPLSRDPASSCDPQPHTWFWFPPGPPASGPHLQRPLRSTPTSLGPCWDMSAHPRGSQGHRQGLQALSPTFAFTSAWDLSWAPGPSRRWRLGPRRRDREGTGWLGSQGRRVARIRHFGEIPSPSCPPTSLL